MTNVTKVTGQDYTAYNYHLYTNGAAQSITIRKLHSDDSTVNIPVVINFQHNLYSDSSKVTTIVLMDEGRGNMKIITSRVTLEKKTTRISTVMLVRLDNIITI